MPRRPLIVLADDLTGAAELAAIAHQSGLHAVVLTTPPKGPVTADVIVCDTATRLAKPAAAARRVRELTLHLSRRPHAGFFKKTDSVLRGPVLAEIEACAGVLGLRRTLLVPCNPSLGRIINNGTYLIAGTPLHRTAFARDPHHPRHTSKVIDLLGPSPRLPVGCHHTADRTPTEGIVVGEADTPADVALWVSRLDRHTLPAGGADFFRLWLVHMRAHRRVRTKESLPTGAALTFSGTATPANPVTPLPGPVEALDARALPAPARLAARLQEQLKVHGTASVIMRGPPVETSGSPTAISRLFVRLADRLHDAKAFQHLLIAGGTTATGVLAVLGWDRLEVAHVWGPGVVTLRPARNPKLLVTLKPGSYAWPAALQNHYADLARQVA